MDFTSRDFSRLFLWGTKMYELVKDADILLFKCPNFPQIGWFISKLSFGEHSHVGLAKWEDGELYCLEFREFRKSRKYKVKDYIAEGSIIDVFRVSPSVKRLDFEPIQNAVLTKIHCFDQPRVDKILQRAEEMMDRKYNWSSIKNIWFAYMPFVRWFRSYNEREKNSKNHMCASFVSYLFRRYYVDLCDFLTDSYTKPEDLARSSITNYLFTLD